MDMLKDWEMIEEIVVLRYKDGTSVTVAREDFERAFKSIITMPKDEVIANYSID